MKRYFIFIFFIFLFIKVLPNDYDFAKFLFEDKDYYRCITELKRQFFNTDDTKEKEKITNLIGVSYFFMNDFNKAEESFSKIKNISPEYEKNYFLTLFLQKNFQKILNENLTYEENRKYFLLSKLFFNKAKLEDFENTDSEIKEIAQKYFKIKKKNPYLALFLSAILPGSGRFYSERGGDGVFSFFTIATPLVGALYYKFVNENRTNFIVTVSLASIFYAGELYGSYNSAKIYFEKKVGVYLNEIKNNYSDILFQPYYSF